MQGRAGGRFSRLRAITKDRIGSRLGLSDSPPCGGGGSSNIAPMAIPPDGSAGGATPSAIAASRSRRVARRVQVGGLGFDGLTEAEVVRIVADDWTAGVGGWIVTPNVDIWLRTRREPGCAELVARADLVVADGMPLVWAAGIAGTPLPERVTGSGLVEQLCQAAGAQGLGLYIVGGGAADIAPRAGAALTRRYPGLRFTGATTPDFGFEHDATRTRDLVDAVRLSGAHLVLVGLGFPKQERLAELIREAAPSAWVLGCGGESRWLQVTRVARRGGPNAWASSGWCGSSRSRAGWPTAT